MLRHQVGVRAQSVAGAFDADHGGMVQQSVEQCGGHHPVAEHFAPFGEAAVGGEHHGAFFVSGADQLEEQAGAAGGHWQVSDFVDDQQCGSSVEAHLGGQSSAAFGFGQGIDQFGQRGSVDAFAGMGPSVLSTLLSKVAEAIQNRDLSALRCLCGVAPVTIRSGGSCRVACALLNAQTEFNPQDPVKLGQCV